MRKRAEITLIALLAWHLSTELAAACSCAKPAPGASPAPILLVPDLKGKDSAVFLGIVENVYPQARSDYETRWPKAYGKDLSEHKPPSLQRARDFILHFWPDAFSRAEKERINNAKSIDDLDSALEFFWQAPRRVRFGIIERFAGPKTARMLLYTGFGDGDCGVDFKAGERWLVDAYRDDSGRWIATICSVTIREEQAGAELTALRARVGARSAP